jgi:hypothetical protein
MKPGENKYEPRSHSELKIGRNTANICIGSWTPFLTYVVVSVDAELTLSGLLNFLVTLTSINKQINLPSSWNHITVHCITSRGTLSHHGALYHITVHCITSRCNLSHHGALYHITVQSITSRGTLSHHGALYHITGHSITSRCNLSHHGALYHITVHSIINRLILICIWQGYSCNIKRNTGINMGILREMPKTDGVPFIWYPKKTKRFGIRVSSCRWDLHTVRKFILLFPYTN